MDVGLLARSSLAPSAHFTVPPPQLHPLAVCVARVCSADPDEPCAVCVGTPGGDLLVQPDTNAVAVVPQVVACGLGVVSSVRVCLVGEDRRPWVVVACLDGRVHLLRLDWESRAKQDAGGGGGGGDGIRVDSPSPPTSPSMPAAARPGAGGAAPHSPKPKPVHATGGGAKNEGQGDDDDEGDDCGGGGGGGKPESRRGNNNNNKGGNGPTHALGRVVCVEHVVVPTSFNAVSTHLFRFPATLAPSGFFTTSPILALVCQSSNNDLSLVSVAPSPHAGDQRSLMRSVSVPSASVSAPASPAAALLSALSPRLVVAALGGGDDAAPRAAVPPPMPRTPSQFSDEDGGHDGHDAGGVDDAAAKSRRRFSRLRRYVGISKAGSSSLPPSPLPSTKAAQSAPTPSHPLTTKPPALGVCSELWFSDAPATSLALVSAATLNGKARDRHGAKAAPAGAVVTCMRRYLAFGLVGGGCGGMRVYAENASSWQQQDKEGAEGGESGAWELEVDVRRGEGWECVADGDAPIREPDTVWCSVTLPNPEDCDVGAFVVSSESGKLRLCKLVESDNDQFEPKAMWSVDLKEPVLGCSHVLDGQAFALCTWSGAVYVFDAVGMGRRFLLPRHAPVAAFAAGLDCMVACDCDGQLDLVTACAFEALSVPLCDASLLDAHPQLASKLVAWWEAKGEGKRGKGGAALPQELSQQGDARQLVAALIQVLPLDLLVQIQIGLARQRGDSRVGSVTSLSGLGVGDGEIEGSDSNNTPLAEVVAAGAVAEPQREAAGESDKAVESPAPRPGSRDAGEALGAAAQAEEGQVEEEPEVVQKAGCLENELQLPAGLD